MMRWFILFVLAIISMGCEKDPSYSVLHKVNVISLLEPSISFSWKTESSEKREQKTYQIIVFKKKNNISEDSIVWDSKKVQSSEQNFISYSGNPLKAGGQYYSKVRVWDQNGTSSKWSSPKKIDVPLNYPRDWKGKWITYDYMPDSPLPVFQKEFMLNKSSEIDYVRFYIAAPGFYEAYLNDEKVGNNILDPAQTNYEDYTFYSAYDLPKDQLNQKNQLRIMLGNGWYNQNVVWDDSMIYGQPVFIAQLVTYFKDGTKKIISTDTSWEWALGPITFSNIYAGENYDATKELKKDNYSPWKKALLAQQHPTNLVEQFAEPIKIMDSIVPQEIFPLGNGKYIFDFGQNFAGWAKLRIEGSKGQEIKMRFGEELSPEGHLDTRSTGVFATKVEQTEKYICKGEGTEVWEPKFTYHGFRYVEVSGLDHPPSKDLLTGMVIYSSMKETGSIVTTDPNIKKLHELAVWTLKSNLQGIPTDCPHREKCGWTGDAHAIAKTLLYNYDANKFLTKYNFDMRSSGREEKMELHFGRNFEDRSIVKKPAGITTMIAPGKRTSGIATPDWGTAIVQLPWYQYLFYGDKEILKEFYQDMKLWVDYVHSKKENGIIPHGLGDWLPPGGNENIDCPVPISSTAFHILDVSILKKAAIVLGNKKDEEKYAQMQKELTKSFNDNFFDIDNKTYGSQTANSLALEIDIVPPKYQHQVAEAIVRESKENFNGFINTGIFGLSRIFAALSENGFEEEAYRVLSKKGNNSFETMWKYYDATTLWEILPTTIEDGEDYDFLMKQSHNHPMQSGYDAWFYSGIGGINPTINKPGFETVLFKPYLTRQIKSFSATYSSPFGEISSSWANEKDNFTWTIKIPTGSEGIIFVPFYEKDKEISINGEKIRNFEVEKPFCMIGTYGSGTYEIIVSK